MTPFFINILYNNDTTKNMSLCIVQEMSPLVVYLDIVVLISFYCNSMILLLTNRLIRAKTSWYRLLFGSFFATLLVPLTIFYPQSVFNTVLGKIGYSILIIMCTFGIGNVRHTMKRLFTFYFISIAMGGGLFGIHFFLNDTLEKHSALNSSFERVGLFIILLGFPLILFFIKTKMDSHIKEKINYDLLYPVAIEMNGHEGRTLGFIDSGNQLNDPITNKPVAICDEQFLQQFFSKREWTMLRTVLLKKNSMKIPNDFKHLISIVPYQGVSGQS